VSKRGTAGGKAAWSGDPPFVTRIKPRKIA